MRFVLAAISLLLPLSAQAMDGALPLQLSEAPAAVGSAVMTADQVRLGRLIAFRAQDDGSLFCIVQLDRDLRVATSPLIVTGLLRAKDGSLRLPEDAATLVSRMKLPLETRAPVKVGPH